MDFPVLKFGQGETIDMLRETAEAFARDKIAPRAAEIDASNEFPIDLWPEMGALGLHGITVPAADNVVRLLPPLTLSEDEFAEAIDRLDAAAASLTAS